ncbi:mCG1049093, isoform CRA_b, partial [Mus musculus]
MCTLLQQPGTSRYILLRDLRTGLDPILRSVHWTGWVPDVNSIRLFVHGMKALPGGHPRRAIPEVDHGVCHVQMLVPTVGNGFGACVYLSFITSGLELTHRKVKHADMCALLSRASVASPIIMCTGLGCESPLSS